MHLTGTVASKAPVVSGPVRVLHHPLCIGDVEEGEILVVETPYPDCSLVLKKVLAVISEKGGRTAHLANVCREMRIPCLVGVKGCMELKMGQIVIVDTEKGCVDTI